MEKVRPLTLEINKDIWDQFKEITPRSITLNDAVVEIIKNYIIVIHKETTKK